MPTAAVRPSLDTPSGAFSWPIIGLLFAATAINYIDRAVFGVLSPLLQVEFRWTEVEYSRMIMAFQLTYAIGYAGAGRLLDRIGVRAGFPLVVGIWSLAALAHGLVALLPPGARLGLLGGSVSAAVFAFGAARALLGLAEGGNFPAAMKTIAEWFPQQRRALATGLFNSGSNVGAVICPLVVPALSLIWGWPGAFYATGAAGLLWLLAWWKLYPRTAHQRFDEAPARAATVGWLRLLRYRQCWTFIVGMAAASPVWWFYIFWGPKFLHQRYGLDLQASSLPLMTIFLGAGFGGIVSGWITSALLARGWSVNAARKAALFGCALAAVPVGFVPQLSNVWGAVALITLAAAGHCGFAANLFTLISDLFPGPLVGAVAGIGGMASSLAALACAELVGQMLAVDSARYQPLFAACAVSYLAGLAVMHALSPRLTPIALDRPGQDAPPV